MFAKHAFRHFGALLCRRRMATLRPASRVCLQRATAGAARVWCAPFHSWNSALPLDVVKGLAKLRWNLELQVVWAIAEGRGAAAAVAKFLEEKSCPQERQSDDRKPEAEPSQQVPIAA